MKTLFMIGLRTHRKKKKILMLRIFLFVFMFITPNVFAENQPQEQNTQTQDTQTQDTNTVQYSQDPSQSQPTETVTSEQERLAKYKRAARKLLLSRFMGKNEKSLKIMVLQPMDYTTLQMPTIITESIQRGVRMYGEHLNVQITDYKMKSLTLEQFRDAVTKLGADLMFVTVMHPTSFDMYLYDRRTPYQIYAHSENIATSAQEGINAEIASYYSKILIRRTLYRYIKKQFYELPRDESPPLLKASIPRFIASTESLEIVNKELISPYMIQVGLGAAFYKTNSTSWHSSTLGLQVGYRILDKAFVKVGFELSAYNTLMGGVSYLFANRSSLFKAELGVSVAQTYASKTLDWDRTDGIPSHTLHIVPNLAIVVPMMDVSLRVDSQLFIGLNGKSVILNVIPGLGISF